MTGPENYHGATLLLEDGCEYGCPHAGCAHEMARLVRAQVHATLALAAATADTATMRPEERDEWDNATGRAEVTP